MKQFNGLDNYIKNDGTVLVLGMFDGMHLGHLALFQQAQEVKEGNTVTVLTFSNHFKGVKGQFKMLLTCEEKAGIIKSMGADELIMQRVDQKLMDTTPYEFIIELKDKINIKAVVVGFDYTFGKGGLGNVEILREHFNCVYVVDKVEFMGIKVSSTHLRDCIQNCDFETYGQLCKSPFFAKGIVVHGNCIGRKNNMPTINVQISCNKMLPPDGVYMTKVKVGNRIYKSIANLGSAPTFNREQCVLEVHIFDFNQSIYGQDVKVYFYKRIRGVKKFNDIHELYEQIANDIEETKFFFKGLEINKQL